MKRIIFVALTVDEKLGGIARSVPRLASAVQKSYTGEVFLIAPRSDQMMIPSGLEGNVVICSSSSEVKRKLRELTDCSANVDFVYHAGMWTALNHFVAKHCRKIGIPVVVSIRSMLDPWALNYHKWRKRLAWELYAEKDLLSASLIHATAAIEAGYVRDCIGDHVPICITPNGVDLKLGHKSRVGSTRRILFLSRIHPKKGIIDLIEAFGMIETAGWELVIGGNDDSNHLRDCQKAAAQQRNSSDIYFINSVRDEDKWNQYASADLFVLPSYSENFGIVVGEALGSHLPVITTNETPWDQLGSMGCGWCIETGADSLAPALQNAVDLTDGERAAMGARGAQWIRDEFGWDEIGFRFVVELKKCGLL